MRRLKERLTYANVVSSLALFLVIAGGTAYAANTVFSSDIVNNEVYGADVRDDSLAGGGLGNVDLKAGSVRSSEVANDSLAGADIDESSLKQGTTWRLVGAAGQPAFGDTESCDWSNYDAFHSSTAFTRDAAGFVHLKGTLKARQGPGVCDNVIERAVFVLPPGYRPQRRESMPVESDETDLSVYIDGPALAGSPAGGVSIGGPVINSDYVSIDGISFRCAPSGANGCP